MAIAPYAIDTANVQSALGQLLVANTGLADRKRQAKAEREAKRVNDLASAGTAVGGLAGLMVGGPQGALMGTSIGGMVGRTAAGKSPSAGELVTTGAQLYAMKQAQDASQLQADTRASEKAGLAGLYDQLPRQTETVTPNTAPVSESAPNLMSPEAQSEMRYQGITPDATRGDLESAAMSGTGGFSAKVIQPEARGLANILQAAQGSGTPLATAANQVALRQAISPYRAPIVVAKGAKAVDPTSGKTIAEGTPEAETNFRTMTKEELPPGATSGQIDETTGKWANIHFPDKDGVAKFQSTATEILKKHLSGADLNAREREVLVYVAQASSPVKLTMTEAGLGIPGLTVPKSTKTPVPGKPATEDAAISDARAAIKDGADKKTIEKRLRDWGYDPGKL